MPCSRSQAEDRHISIHSLIFPGIDQVGLVEDAHTAIRTDTLVELSPRPQVRIVFVARELFQVLERAPVLYCYHNAPGKESLCSQKTLFGMLVQRANHWPHRHRSRNPLPKSKELINPHSNHKDHEGFISLGSETPR